MYSFPYFKDNNDERIVEFMQQYAFATLIAADGSNSPVATQVPVFTEKREGALFITGHIQRKTDHHKVMEANANVLVLFTGPHAYISASWYSDPQIASTWNYMTVQAKGNISFLAEEELLHLLSRTTAHYENNPHSPALMEKMPPHYVRQQAKAIVAFEIEVAQLDHVFKLSQNRDEESYRNIIYQLEQQNFNAKAIAAEMKKRQVELFSK
jgi:transcriptional regulator